MDKCVREMTFEEEYEILKREANKLFESEIDGCEAPKANCIVRRALRCIDKLTKENKLAKEYRELEEQGRLLKLPCKIGDTLYVPTRNFISELRVVQISVGRDSVFFHWMLNTGIYPNLDGCDNLQIGKSVFLTKEEAEARLKEMENKTNEV